MNQGNITNAVKILRSGAKGLSVRCFGIKMSGKRGRAEKETVGITNDRVEILEHCLESHVKNHFKCYFD